MLQNSSSPPYSTNSKAPKYNINVCPTPTTFITTNQLQFQKQAQSALQNVMHKMTEHFQLVVTLLQRKRKNTSNQLYLASSKDSNFPHTSEKKWSRQKMLIPLTPVNGNLFSQSKAQTQNNNNKNPWQNNTRYSQVGRILPQHHHGNFCPQETDDC